MNECTEKMGCGGNTSPPDNSRVRSSGNNTCNMDNCTVDASSKFMGGMFAAATLIGIGVFVRYSKVKTKRKKTAITV